MANNNDLNYPPVMKKVQLKGPTYQIVSRQGQSRPSTTGSVSYALKNGPTLSAGSSPKMTGNAVPLGSRTVVGMATQQRNSVQLGGAFTPTGARQQQVFPPQRNVAQSSRVGLSFTPTSGNMRTTAQYTRGVVGSAPGHAAVKRPLDYVYGPKTDTKVPRSVPKIFSNQLGSSHRSADKNKGLRHFSTKVCEKVKEKGSTSYNEVADELVREYFMEECADPARSEAVAEKSEYDMKNIRRRVYDALNVLMAMNIIEKERKEIRWVGLPTSTKQECSRLESDRTRRADRVRQKTETLQELVLQLVAYKSLVQRNRERERIQGRPVASSVLFLPYIVVNTDKKTMIDCSISNDKTEYQFNFDQPFEIHDDIEVLKRLGLTRGLADGTIAKSDLPQVRNYLPQGLREYVDEIASGRLLNSVVPPVANQVSVTSTIDDSRSQYHPDANGQPVTQYVTLPPQRGISLVKNEPRQQTRYATMQKVNQYFLKTATSTQAGPVQHFRPAHAAESADATVDHPPVGAMETIYTGSTGHSEGSDFATSDIDSTGSNSNHGY